MRTNVDIIRIVDKAGVDSLIENARFENALIVGPAVLAPLDHVTIANCRFDGDPDTLLIEVDEGRRVVGVIGLRNVTFERCEFRNVGLIGTHQNVAQFRQGFMPQPSAQAQGSH